MIATSLVVGGTYRFEIHARKRNSSGALVAWDLSAATVTLYLRDPDGNVTAYAASLSGERTDAAYYVTLTTDLDADGEDWARRWKIVDGATTLLTPWQIFNVEP